MIKYSVLSSGSCGNGYIFNYKNESLLIDMGITLSNLASKLAEMEIDINSIKNVLITHLHPDHIKGLRRLKEKYNPNIYISSESVLNEKRGMEGLKISTNNLVQFNINDTLALGCFEIDTFATSHDSIGSTGYKIRVASKNILHLTDLGYTTESMLSMANNTNLLFIESNYCDKLLKESKYPSFLKKRIAGDKGHLSNEDAMDFLSKIDTDNMMVYFIHLSDNCNTVDEVALLADSIKLKNYQVCKRGGFYKGELN